MMYSKSELKNAIFFKLGTIRCVSSYSDLSKEMQTFWKDKYHQRYKDNTEESSCLTYKETYEKHANFIPEFSKIISIDFGLIEELKPNAPLTISIKTITGTEKEIVESIAKILDGFNAYTLGGFNIVNFQIPYVIKKMLLYKISLPFLLNLRNKKPWDINLIDIMRDYQGNTFGDVDVRLVATHFGIETKNVGDLELSLQVALHMSI